LYFLSDPLRVVGRWPGPLCPRRRRGAGGAGPTGGRRRLGRRRRGGPVDSAPHPLPPTPPPSTPASPLPVGGSGEPARGLSEGRAGTVLAESLPAFLPSPTGTRPTTTPARARPV